jgi:hypothetical protein
MAADTPPSPGPRVLRLDRRRPTDRGATGSPSRQPPSEGPTRVAIWWCSVCRRSGATGRKGVCGRLGQAGLLGGLSTGGSARPSARRRDIRRTRSRAFGSPSRPVPTTSAGWAPAPVANGRSLTTPGLSTGCATSTPRSRFSATSARVYPSRPGRAQDGGPQRPDPRCWIVAPCRDAQRSCHRRTERRSQPAMAGLCQVQHRTAAVHQLMPESGASRR